MESNTERNAFINDKGLEQTGIWENGKRTNWLVAY